MKQWLLVLQLMGFLVAWVGGVGGLEVLPGVCTIWVGEGGSFKTAALHHL